MIGKLISGIMISALYLLSPVEKASVNDFTIHVNGDVPDVSYGLYEDRSCEKPIMDGNGKQILLKTDDKGNASVQLQQNAFWLKETGTPDGWYQDDALRYVTKDSLTINKDKIQLRFGMVKGDERITAHLQLKEAENDTVIADWMSEGFSYPLMNDEKVKLKAGTTYIISAIDMNEGYYAKPLKVEVEKYAQDQKQRTYSLEAIPYAEIQITNKLYDDTPAKGSVFGLYEDETCEKPVSDIYNQEIHLVMNEEGKAEAFIDTGKYYLKEEDTESCHYLDPKVYTLDIGKDGIVFEHKDVPVQAVISLKDAKSQKDLAGNIQIGGSETYASKDTVLLERDKTYHVKPVNWPEGYHGLQELQFETKDYHVEPIQIDIPLSAFAIDVSMMDQETNKLVIGGQYQILDAKGNIRQSFEMKEGVQITPLADNQSYILHEVKSPEGYISMKDVPFSIDGESLNYHIYTKHRRYYHLSVIAKTDDKKVNPALAGIYRDAECTKEAVDITGKKADASSIMNLYAGTYWLLVKDKEQYCHSDPKKVTLSADKPFENRIEIHLKRPDAKILVEDENGHQIKGAKLLIKDEDGKDIGSFISQGEDSLARQGFNDQIRAGHTYRIVMENIPTGLYKIRNKEVSLKTSEKDTDAVTSSSLKLNPYAVMTMSELCDGNIITGGRWKLYTDKDCTHMAKDANQKLCDKVTDKDGSLSFEMLKGDYWLKQEEAPEYCYRNPDVYPIHIDPYKSWQFQQNTEAHKAELIVQLINKYGEPIKGGLFEVKDRNGRLVTQFENHGDIHLSGSWLKPGESYTIHERVTPEGYQMNQTDIVCHIPESMPDKIPVLQIRYRNMDTVKTKLPEKTADHAETKRPSKPFLIAEAIILTASILLFLKMKSLHKK